MDYWYEKAIEEKVRYRPRLIPILSHTLNIPERLYDYHPRLFICFNRVEQKYEVHSLDQEDSYSATLPYKDLDARTLRWIYNNDIRVHGKDIFRRIEKSEEQREKSKEREFKNWVEDVASETRSLFAKDAWA